MKKLTITLDEETADWARVCAARHNMSVSRLVGEMLAKRMQESSEYDRAKRAWLARSPADLGSLKTAYPCRDVFVEIGSGSRRA